MKVVLEKSDIRTLVRILQESSDTLAKKQAQLSRKVGEREATISIQEKQIETEKDATVQQFVRSALDRDMTYVERTTAKAIDISQDLSESRRLMIIFMEALKRNG